MPGRHFIDKSQWSVLYPTAYYVIVKNLTTIINGNMIYLLAFYKGYTSMIRHLFTLLCPAWILDLLILFTGRAYLVGLLYAFHQLISGCIINTQLKFSSASQEAGISTSLLHKLFIYNESHGTKLSHDVLNSDHVPPSLANSQTLGTFFSSRM